MYVHPWGIEQDGLNTLQVQLFFQIIGLYTDKTRPPSIGYMCLRHEIS